MYIVQLIIKHRTDEDYVSIVLTGALLPLYEEVMEHKGQIYVMIPTSAYCFNIETRRLVGK